MPSCLRLDEFVKKVAIKSMESFVVSPGPNPHVLCFIPPLKGQPALIQLRQLSMDTDLPVMSSKMSFNCDKCTMVWNSRGNAALATATVDVDKSDKSYYGVSHLFIITTTQYDIIQVHLDKTGPLHDTKWAPSGTQFAVCYGFMPSKVAIYSVRGDVIWQHGEGHRNELHYNPFGTILAVCSFGNISSGKMEFWNVATKDMIDSFEVPSTTSFEWAPDGNHFTTATTAPRLRISNGYRIWHYTAKCLLNVSYDKENEKKEELWSVCWKPSNAYAKTEVAVLSAEQKAMIANNIITSNNITKHPIDLMAPGAISKKGAYIPPNMRKPEANNKTAQPTSTKPPISERERKIKNLEKKLDDISKLKERKASGATLELNQMDKIKSEISLRQELQLLSSTELSH